jgi:regulator of RNase E activity RraB
MIPKSKMPHFFYDDKNNSSEVELMIDYFISWTLRCSISNQIENNKVKEYSKKILLFLLKAHIDDNNFENIIIKKVKTWKQWENIDLIAEVEIEENNTIKKYILVFENKLYSKLHDNQLNKYIEIVEKEYEEKNDKIVYIYLTGSDNIPDEDLKLCIKENYNAYTVQDLRNSFGDVEESGNYLFDEFWFRYFFYDRGNDFTDKYISDNFLEI